MHLKNVNKINFKNMYTLKMISEKWEHINDHYENILAVSEKRGYDINAILINIAKLAKYYKTDEDDKNSFASFAIFEDAFDKLMIKVKQSNKKGLPPSEYVANKTGFNYKSETSFYDFKNTIKIEYKNKTYKGIIRVSDHDVDLNKWAQNNSEYDFGLSFVIAETECEWKGNNIVDVPNRNIVIGEYLYMTSRNDFDFLDKLISEILNIKRHKIFLLDANTKIMQRTPKIVTNSSILIESITNAIKDAFKKIK